MILEYSAKLTCESMRDGVRCCTETATFKVELTEMGTQEFQHAARHHFETLGWQWFGIIRCPRCAGEKPVYAGRSMKLAGSSVITEAKALDILRRIYPGQSVQVRYSSRMYSVGTIGDVATFRLDMDGEEVIRATIGPHQAARFFCKGQECGET